MKIALHSVSYSGTWGGQEFLPLEAFVDKAAKLGYDAIELAAKRPHASPLDLDARARETLRVRIEDAGLSVCCLASYHDYTHGYEHPDMAHAQKEVLYLREVIALSADLGAPIVRTYTGYLYPQPSYREQWQTVVSCLREGADFAAEAGVILAVQNHSTLACHHLTLLDLLAEVDHPQLRVVFDAPTLVEQKEDLRQAVLAMGDLIVHSHLSDFADRPHFTYDPGNVRYLPEQPLHPAVPIGQGVTDYETFVRALAEVGYQGALSYEMCSPLVGGGSMENLDRCARESLAYLRELVAKLDA